MTRASCSAFAGRSVLVTGGAGFIGSHVTEALLARGAEVRVLDDLSGGRATDLPLHDPNLDLRIGDMGDRAVVADALRGMHACVHLAAAGAPWRPTQDPYETALSNILGFTNVLEAMRQERVGRLVYASSAEVYGEAGDCPLGEDLPPRPVSAHGMEKLLVEGYAQLHARQHGLSALGLRYFNVFGLRSDMGKARAGVIARWTDRIGRDRPAVVEGDGAQTRDFIHVEDAAAATLAALASDACGVCNVAAGARVELRALAQLLGVALGRRPRLQHAAPRPGAMVHAWADVARLRERLGFVPAQGFKARLFELGAEWGARQHEGPAAPDRAQSRPPPPTVPDRRALS